MANTIKERDQRSSLTNIRHESPSDREEGSVVCVASLGVDLNFILISPKLQKSVKIMSRLIHNRLKEYYRTRLTGWARQVADVTRSMALFMNAGFFSGNLEYGSFDKLPSEIRTNFVRP